MFLRTKLSTKELQELPLAVIRVWGTDDPLTDEEIDDVISGMAVSVMNALSDNEVVVPGLPEDTEEKAVEEALRILSSTES